MSATHRIRVLILHDDPIARAGLAAAFAMDPGLGLSNDERSADVVVADHAHGVAWARRHAVSAGAPKVVIVAGIDREWEIRSALESGVRGYLLGGCTLDELAAGVRAVHRGARHLSAQVAQRLAESMFAEALTMREENVLQCVVEGLGNKAIGRQLGIAEGTVKSHLKAAFEKLGVSSRTQAAAAVERRGLLRQASGPAVPKRSLGSSLAAAKDDRITLRPRSAGQGTRFDGARIWQ